MLCFFFPTLDRPYLLTQEQEHKDWALAVRLFVENQEELQRTSVGLKPSAGVSTTTSSPSTAPAPSHPGWDDNTATGPFLSSLRLDQYTSAFVKEGFETVGDLRACAEEDYTLLGVKIGHKRRLQKALKEGHAAEAEPLSPLRSAVVTPDEPASTSSSVFSWLRSLVSSPSASEGSHLESLRGDTTLTAEEQFQKGENYFFGKRGVERDTKQAVAWYRKAAAQGHAKAQSNLVNCYFMGNGVEKDAKEAVAWLRKAAAQEHAEAQSNLGACYLEGNGVEKDAAQAVAWFRKAAVQGDAAAQSNLGSCYQNGTGVEKDAAQAVACYRKAAAQGLAQAQFNLGVCYLSGEGVEKDAKQAVAWFRKAAAQGFALAQYNLGVCYRDGEGVEKDAKEAVAWLRKAAAQEHAEAQFNLGNCYLSGEGVEKDAAQAVAWFRKAAAQGLAQAQRWWW